MPVLETAASVVAHFFPTQPLRLPSTLNFFCCVCNQPLIAPSMLAVPMLSLASRLKSMSPVGRMVSAPLPTCVSSTLTSPLSFSSHGRLPWASVYRTEPLTVNADLPPLGRALTPTSPRSLNGGGVTHTPTPTLVR